ncbi:Extracellular ligand-binding receptor [Fimbriimonas ginsengisoli Gsoil 348]|uniref:Extracellular ligand-binding receptor n=1 Tax=Fimbriimonas ginsengisoli Gsoil 348 TaxID=661478 RepID=A0A068NP76_FIMGI|nr:Extracellular ligand-binding receptor [Fimbriimonas ginsengisoli Gsoil 348]
MIGCGGSSGNNPGTTPVPTANELRIGGLFSLTGNWNTLGKASKAAVELARDDVNAYFASRSIATRVTLFVTDTKLLPETAAADLNSLVDKQVRYVVGPQSSSEVARLKATADSSGTLLISQGSTASSLSIADDNVFRMVPDDVREAKALVALARADGIQALIPVARDDAGNGGLFTSVSARFSDVGGEVAAGIRYGANETDFTATLNSVRAAIVALRATHTDAQIGVYLAGFDEDAQILALAQADPTLSAVKWYGSDGVVSSAALSSNAGSAAFMSQHGFPNPIFGLDDSAVGTWSPVAQRIKAKSGVDPDAFALSAYDAVWLAALSYQAAGGSAATATDRRNSLFATASTYTGVTGPTKFDASGDRNDGNFDFWSVGGSAGSYRWMRVASYKAADGSIVRIP